MHKLPNVFLIGPSGAGKSTVGREVAKMLEMDFYDTDLVIEERTGVEIAWIFDKEGEAGFRARETDVLRDMLRQSNAVIATGGGAILSEVNRHLLRQANKVVLLTVGLKKQHDRAATNQHTRPLLRGDNLQEKLVAMAAERAPLYAQVAHIAFETDTMHVRSVAKRVVEYLRREGF